MSNNTESKTPQVATVDGPPPSFEYVRDTAGRTLFLVERAAAELGVRPSFKKMEELASQEQYTHRVIGKKRTGLVDIEGLQEITPKGGKEAIKTWIRLKGFK